MRTEEEIKQETRRIKAAVARRAALAYLGWTLLIVILFILFAS